MARSSFVKALAVLALLDAALVLPRLGTTTLWNIDEGRIAEAAREMRESGDWITPRINTVPFSCYPPLPYWLLASTGSLLGFTEFAMRLPTALAGIGLLVVIGLIGGRLAGPGAGLASAAVLATLPSFADQQTLCRADVLTAFFAVAAFERFLAWAEPREGEARRGLAAMYVLAALGILTKGPIAVALLGVAGFAWFLVRGRWRLLQEMRFERGIPAMLLIVLPWYAAVGRANGADFLHQNLVLENLSAFSDGYQQKRPVHFYARVAPPLLLPWLLVLPLAWRVRGAPGLRLALFWLAGTALFLTISSAKRPSYVVYFCPPMAAVCGIVLEACGREAPRLLRSGLAGLGALFAAGGAALALLPKSLWTSDRVAAMADSFPLLGGAVATGGIAILLATLRLGPARGAGLLAGLLGGTFLATDLFMAARWDAEGRAGVLFCRRVSAALPAGAALYSLAPEETEGAYPFYLQRPLVPRRGEAGHYLLADFQRDRLAGAGIPLEILDSVPDHRGRLKYFARIHP